MADLQFGVRQSSHLSSARYAARHSQKSVVIPEIKVGDLVYVKSDRSKAAARDSYVVLSIDTTRLEATVQKFPMVHPKRNILVIQLQNLYRVSSHRCPELVPVSFPKNYPMSFPMKVNQRPVNTHSIRLDLSTYRTPVYTSPDSEDEDSFSEDDNMEDEDGGVLGDTEDDDLRVGDSEEERSNQSDEFMEEDSINGEESVDMVNRDEGADDLEEEMSDQDDESVVLDLGDIWK